MPNKRKEARSHSSDMWKRQKVPFKLTQEDVEVVEKLFHKQFNYMSASSQASSGTCINGDSTSTVEDWVGENPSLTKESTQDPKLRLLKQEMNAMKDQLSSKDIETWHAHTTNCNLAAKVIPYVKSLRVELCTQAWVKFSEIVSTYPIVPRQNFLSVHLCEAPGAFVASLNYYLFQKEFPYMWDWRATTLHPYYEANTMGEMIADDRLIRNTYSQWFFGPDGSGDITAKNHVKDLCSMLNQVSVDQELPPLLVTADGSKDCQINPAEQEASLTCLHYCEMISACLILAKGGSFVLKVFTMFEPATVALVFLLNIMFTKVHATKPATSKSGNSETYLVCLGYRKNVREETLWKLLDLTVYSHTFDSTVNFIKDIPKDFLQKHIQCCQNYAQWQIQTIKHNIELYDSLSPSLSNKLQDMQELALKIYLKKTEVGLLSHYRKIAGSYGDKSNFKMISPGRPWQSQTRSDWSSKNLKGTFHLRQNLSSMGWEDRVRAMEIREITPPDIHLQSRCAIKDEEIEELMEKEMGTSFSVIENSRLCDAALVKDLTLLLKNCDVRKQRQPFYMVHTEVLGKMISDLISEQPENMSPSPKTNHHPSIYWVGGVSQEKPCPLYHSFLENKKDLDHIKYVTTDEDWALLANSSQQEHIVFCNMTYFCNDFTLTTESNYEELYTKKKFLMLTFKLLQHLQHCHQLVLLTSTFLSRFSAGLLYILARSFQKTSIHGEASLWMHHFVVLDNFLGVCPALLDHLEEANKILDKEVRDGQTTIMAVVTFYSLVNDKRFVQFVTACNNFTVTGFINKLLKTEQLGSVSRYTLKDILKMGSEHYGLVRCAMMMVAQLNTKILKKNN